MIIHVFDWNNCDYKEVTTFFDKNSFVIFKNFISSSILAHIEKVLKKDSVEPFEHYEGSFDIHVRDKLITYKLERLLSSKNYLDLIINLFRECQLGNIHGRISLANASTNCNWHNDYNKRRKLGISVRIGSEEFSGGEFCFKIGSKQLKYKILHGEAVLFKIDNDFFHRVLKINDEGNRLHYVGWYDEK